MKTQIECYEALLKGEVLIDIEGNKLKIINDRIHCSEHGGEYLLTHDYKLLDFYCWHVNTSVNKLNGKVHPYRVRLEIGQIISLTSNGRPYIGELIKDDVQWFELECIEEKIIFDKPSIVINFIQKKIRSP